MSQQNSLIFFINTIVVFCVINMIKTQKPTLTFVASESDKIPLTNYFSGRSNRLMNFLFWSKKNHRVLQSKSNWTPKAVVIPLSEVILVNLKVRDVSTTFNIVLSL